jgi:hypothetical protein
MSVADVLVLGVALGFCVGMYAVIKTSGSCSREEEREEKIRWERMKRESEAREHEQEAQDDEQP